MVLKRAASIRGIKLSDDELSELESSLPDGSEERIQGPNPSCKTIDISPEDVQAAIDQIGEDLQKVADAAIASVMGEMPKKLLESLFESAPQMIREHYRLGRRFERRLYDRWRDGLDQLKMLTVIASEAGESHLGELNNRFEHKSGDETERNRDLAEALVGLHVRAVRIASEILCLLKGGFADGANARWRSLHEIAMVMMFLRERGNDAAYRYLRHANVSRYRASNQYQLHCTRLGYDPIAPEEMSKHEANFRNAVSQFGNDFAGDYGWAAAALNKRRPTFADIESSLNSQHWRPHFRLACQSVHPDSQGMVFSLGIPGGGICAGASDAGLADPGHSAAISLLLASTAFLTFCPTIDSLVTCGIMQLLTDRIGEALLSASKSTNDGSPSPEAAEDVRGQPDGRGAG
jgi:hypothetical protein